MAALVVRAQQIALPVVVEMLVEIPYSTELLLLVVVMVVARAVKMLAMEVLVVEPLAALRLVLLELAHLVKEVTVLLTQLLHEAVEVAAHLPQVTLAVMVEQEPHQALLELL
jgi:hypothetical protein